MRKANILPIKSDEDVVVARATGREFARDFGFNVAEQTRLATAISELTLNVVRYAGEGELVIADESDEDRARIRVAVEDRGPGIADIEQAMADGFSTGGGLGGGLPGTKRLVHEFEIESVPGQTRVTIAMVRPRLDA